MNFDDGHDDDDDDIHKDINILSSHHTHGVYTVQYST